MPTRQIVLSRGWGLTPKDAERIARALAITGIHFVALARRAPRTPAIIPRGRRACRGIRGPPPRGRPQARGTGQILLDRGGLLRPVLHGRLRVLLH